MCSERKRLIHVLWQKKPHLTYHTNANTSLQVVVKENKSETMLRIKSSHIERPMNISFIPYCTSFYLVFTCLTHYNATEYSNTNKQNQLKRIEFERVVLRLCLNLFLCVLFLCVPFFFSLLDILLFSRNKCQTFIY